MTDRILLWFQCANPTCELIHKLGHRVCFLSYVTGRKINTFDKYEFQCDDDSIGMILLYDFTTQEGNSYITPILDKRYCKRCYELVVKNESLEKYW